MAGLEKARELGSKIEETHKRVGAVQVEISHQVQDILERTRKGTAHFTERLTALESYAADLGKKHHHEVDERKADQTAVLRRILPLQSWLPMDNPYLVRLGIGSLHGRRLISSGATAQSGSPSHQ